VRYKKGETILAVVTAERKRSPHTRFSLGVGIVVDDTETPTGQIRFRTEQIDSGVPPVVGTLSIEAAEEFCTGLQKAISIAKKSCNDR
jgi:hypothetical protein